MFFEGALKCTFRAVSAIISDGFDGVDFGFNGKQLLANLGNAKLIDVVGNGAAKEAIYQTSKLIYGDSRLLRKGRRIAFFVQVGFVLLHILVQFFKHFVGLLLVPFAIVALWLSWWFEWWYVVVVVQCPFEIHVNKLDIEHYLPNDDACPFVSHKIADWQRDNHHTECHQEIPLEPRVLTNVRFLLPFANRFQPFRHKSVTHREVDYGLGVDQSIQPIHLYRAVGEIIDEPIDALSIRKC